MGLFVHGGAYPVCAIFFFLLLNFFTPGAQGNDGPWVSVVHGGAYAVRAIFSPFAIRSGKVSGS
jgi:hypothetical protein